MNCLTIAARAVGKIEELVKFYYFLRF